MPGSHFLKVPSMPDPPCRNLEVACSNAQIDLLDVACRFAGVASGLALKEVDTLSIHDYPPWLLVGGRGRPAYHLERLEETSGSLLGERMREVSGEKEGLEGKPALRSASTPMKLLV